MLARADERVVEIPLSVAADAVTALAVPPPCFPDLGFRSVERVLVGGGSSSAARAATGGTAAPQRQCVAHVRGGDARSSGSGSIGGSVTGSGSSSGSSSSSSSSSSNPETNTSQSSPADRPGEHHPRAGSAADGGGAPVAVLDGMPGGMVARAVLSEPAEDAALSARYVELTNQKIPFELVRAAW